MSDRYSPAVLPAAEGNYAVTTCLRCGATVRYSPEPMALHDAWHGEPTPAPQDAASRAEGHDA